MKKKKKRRICLPLQKTQELWVWVGKMPWRKKWQPTAVFLPGELHGQRSLVGYGPWACKDSDTTELLTYAQSSLHLLGHFLFYLWILLSSGILFQSCDFSSLLYECVQNTMFSMQGRTQPRSVYSAFWPNWTNPHPPSVAHSFLPPRPSFSLLFLCSPC